MWYLTGIYRQVLPVGVDIWISRAAQAVRAGGCEATALGHCRHRSATRTGSLAPQGPAGALMASTDP